MSETSSELSRVAPLRPPSTISLLANRLKCSNLQDPLYDLAQIQPISHDNALFWRCNQRPKTVNFNRSEICWIDDINSRTHLFSNNSSDIDTSPATCDSGNEDSSAGCFATSASFSSYFTGCSCEGLSIIQGHQQPTSQQCLSTSAPDDSINRFSTTLDSVLCDGNGAAKARQHLTKRPCRSLSASSHPKFSNGLGPRKNNLARPIALRIPLKVICSPVATTGASDSFGLSSTALSLITTGSVKLRNIATSGHRTTSRLSWHQPIACSVGRRYLGHPGSNVSRHSVVCGGTTPDMFGDVKLGKPPSFTCVSPSTSNPSDIDHLRPSAFTPTARSRCTSLIDDDRMSCRGSVSSPCRVIGAVVSDASSGFFQESCSSSINSDSQCLQTGNVMKNHGLNTRPVDSTVSRSDNSPTSLSIFDQQNHNCTFETKSRCKSQPASVAGATACCCGDSVISTDCLSRHMGLKQRRCSQDVGLAWDFDDFSGCLFGSQDSTFLPLDPTFETSIGNHEASIGPLCTQQPIQTNVSTFPENHETTFRVTRRRKELSGLSEASEEDELNEAVSLHPLQRRSCCPLEEDCYDTGTPTPPPPQIRFGPIEPAPSRDEGNEETAEKRHDSHVSGSSTYSTTAIDATVFVSSDKDNAIDEQDSFGGFTSGTNHRLSPMQTEQLVQAPSGYSAIDRGFADVNMIEQD